MKRSSSRAGRRRGAAPDPWARRQARGARTTCAALLVVMALVLGGCASARNELGTVNSDCYITLPTASAAVHHQGKLEGVRLVTVASLRMHTRLLYRAALSTEKANGSVCLVAYTGRFTATAVERPVGRASGRVAVVELTYPGKHLVVTLLLLRPPIPFGHARA